jgi:hypothetical protein
LVFKKIKSRKGKGWLVMKKLILIALILMFTTGTVTAFAAGGKNQGTTGKGKIYTGSTGKGSTSQPRTGR